MKMEDFMGPMYMLNNDYSKDIKILVLDIIHVGLGGKEYFKMQ